jgi:hypothetical protein
VGIEILFLWWTSSQGQKRLAEIEEPKMGIGMLILFNLSPVWSIFLMRSSFRAGVLRLWRALSAMRSSLDHQLAQTIWRQTIKS